MKVLSAGGEGAGSIGPDSDPRLVRPPAAGR